MTGPTSGIQQRPAMPATDPLVVAADAPLTADEAATSRPPGQRNTLRSYRSDWAECTGWCAGRGLDRRAALGRLPCWPQRSPVGWVRFRCCSSAAYSGWWRSPWACCPASSRTLTRFEDPRRAWRRRRGRGPIANL